MVWFTKNTETEATEQTEKIQEETGQNIVMVTNDETQANVETQVNVDTSHKMTETEQYDRQNTARMYNKFHNEPLEQEPFKNITTPIIRYNSFIKPKCNTEHKQYIQQYRIFIEWICNIKAIRSALKSTGYKNFNAYATSNNPDDVSFIITIADGNIQDGRINYDVENYVERWTPIQSLTCLVFNNLLTEINRQRELLGKQRFTTIYDYCMDVESNNFVYFYLKKKEYSECVNNMKLIQKFCDEYITKNENSFIMKDELREEFTIWYKKNANIVDLPSRHKIFRYLNIKFGKNKNGKWNGYELKSNDTSMEQEEESSSMSEISDISTASTVERANDTNLTGFIAYTNKITHNSYVLTKLQPKVRIVSEDTVHYDDSTSYPVIWELFPNYRPIYYNSRYSGWIVGLQKKKELEDFGVKFLQNRHEPETELSGFECVLCATGNSYVLRKNQEYTTMRNGILYADGTEYPYTWDVLKDIYRTIYYSNKYKGWCVSMELEQDLLDLGCKFIGE